MTEERLQLLPENFLREIAVKEGISFNEAIDKQDLIALILEAIEEDRDENVSTNNPAMQIKERKFDITLNEQFDFEEDQYPLPDRYNETKIVMLLRDPAWAYTYWDIKDSEVTALKFGDLSGELNLRVYEMTDRDCIKSNIKDFSDIPITLADNSWYINLPETGIFYCIELILKNREDEKTLCRSNSIKSPLWEVGEMNNFQEMKGTGNDLLLVAGVYDLNAAEAEGKIPQRIISMIDSEFLE